MAPEKAPAFQFYPRDFLSDERVLVMDCAARGAYITLLAVAWLEGSLPVDETALIRLAQTTPREWKRIRENVLSCFYQQDGRYLQKRLEVERQKQEAFRQQASNAGKRSAERRLNARSTPVEQTYQREGNGNPTLLSSSSSSESPKPPEGAGEAWELWRELTTKHRPAACPPLTATQRDYGYCQTIAGKRGGVDWWTKVIRQFLITDHADIDAKPRTLGMLLHWWGWIEEGLIHSGQYPKKEAA